MNVTLSNLTPGNLRRAADLREKIDILESQLAQLLGNESTDTTATTGFTPRGRKKMSAAARARIAAGARARWARERGEEPSARPRRKMSAAAKARLAAVARERWRKAKASGKTAL